ncbi:MAG: nucleotidyl transferase AbiEii/AbiGii toxin family protein, partial [Paludibacter sp.]|nr:nucleotidyl transferase AbiEii/AbiGii toxin family protein [Paludibacter sp.]
MYYNTVSEQVLEYLQKLMANSAFDDFVLVGGTALSLQLGHRESVDIDFFTSEMYGSIDMQNIKKVLLEMFEYTEWLHELDERSMVYCLHIGKNRKETVKLDLCYTEEFIRPIIEQDGVRIASLEDIAAMKLQAITSRKKRKDFWDIYE